MWTTPLCFTSFQQRAYFKAATSEEAAIRDHLQLLLNTPPGECRSLPEYGNPLLSAGNSLDTHQWPARLVELIRRWEPRLTEVTVQLESLTTASGDLDRRPEILVQGKILSSRQPFGYIFKI